MTQSKRGCYGHLGDRCISGGCVDFVRRLIFLLLVAWCLPSSAATAQYYYYAFPAGPYRLSALQACQDRVDEANTHPQTNYGHRTYTVVSADINSCVIAWPANEYGSAGSGDSGQLFSNYMCPLKLGTTVGQGTECAEAPPITCTAGKSLGKWTSGPVQAYCSAGCVVQPETVVTPSKSVIVLYQTGDKCSGSEPPLPDTPQSTGTGACPGGADVCPPTNGTCPKGTAATEVAGQALCVGIPKSAAEPASSASAPQNSGTCPGGASVCPPTNGSCPAGTSAEDVAGNVVCVALPSTSGKTSSETTTTTKTTTNPDGSTTTTSTTTGTESKPNDIASFCKENQGAAICGDAGSWAGSCNGGFTCGGDAVQCAQAQAAWQANCSLKVDPNDAAVKLGQAAIGAGVGGFAAGTDPGAGTGNTVNISTDFDRTNPYSSACPADKTFTLMGKTVALPFAQLCPYLQLAGYILIAVTLLAATKIALGGN